MIKSWKWQVRLDGIANLKLAETLIALPNLDEVLIKINAVSLNYKDAETIEGLWNHHKKVDLPQTIVPCSDAAGEVFCVGKRITRWKKGVRVLSFPILDYKTGKITPGMLRYGISSAGKCVLCEYRIFKEDALFATPPSLSDKEAYTLLVAVMTAWMAINGTRPLGSPGGKGEVVLILGTGGVSVNGLQIAKASGAEGNLTDLTMIRNWPSQSSRPIGTLKLSASQNIKEQTSFLKPVTLKLLPSLSTVSDLVGCSMQLGPPLAVDPPGDRMDINVQAIRTNVTLVGIWNDTVDRFEMLAFYVKHEIKPVIDMIFKFEEAKKALQYMRDGRHFGKVVVRVAS